MASSSHGSHRAIHLVELHVLLPRCGDSDLSVAGRNLEIVLQACRHASVLASVAYQVASCQAALPIVRPSAAPVCGP